MKQNVELSRIGRLVNPSEELALREFAEEASSPSPADGAAGVDVDADLAWAAGSNPGTVTVVSDQGGSDTATVVIR